MDERKPKRDEEGIKKEKEKNEQLKKRNAAKLLPDVQKFIDRCNYHRYGDEKNGFQDNYKTGTICGNIVGDRIRYILKSEGMTVLELAEQSKVDRSSLNRFLRRDYPDIPKPDTLLKIISKLPCFTEDFLYSPDDFQVWENAYSGYPLQFDKPVQDYEVWKSVITAQLSMQFAYQSGEKRYKIPPQIMDVLCKQIQSTFDTVDILLDYPAL